MAVSSPPPLPDRGKTGFSTLFSTWLTWFNNTFVTEFNAAITALNFNSTNDTSATSNTIGTGTLTFTVSASKSFTDGMFLVIADDAAPTTNGIFAQVVSYAGTSLVVTGLSVWGSGTKTAWKISQSTPGAVTGNAVAGLLTNTYNGDQTLTNGAFNEDYTTLDSTLAPTATDIWTGQGNIINFTGSATVTGFAAAPQAGARRTLICAGACSFTAGANMIIDGVASYPSAIGDEVEVFAVTTTQFRLRIKRKNGMPVMSELALQSITATASAGALTLTQNPMGADFRSSSATNGTNTPTNLATTSMTVPSGTNIGSQSGQIARLVQLVLSNGEVAVANLNGLSILDESGVITTEAISQTCTFTGSIAVTTGILTLTTPLTGTFAIGQELSGTSVTQGTYVQKLLTGTLGAAASTYQTNQVTAAGSTTITGKAGMAIYSTTARTGFAYRVAGTIDAINTAGSWASPSLVSPAGGLAISNISTLGVGQTWIDTTISSGTTYYNTTTKPKLINVSFTNTASANGLIKISLNGQKDITVAAAGNGAATAALHYGNGCAIIPPFCSYKFTNTNAASVQFDEFS